MKLTNYIIFMTGLMLVYYVTGLLPADSISGSLMTILLNPSSLSESGISLKALTAIGGITAASIFIGIVFESAELALMGAYTLSLITLLWDAMAVYTRVNSVSPYIAILLFSPLIFVYMISTIQFWRGKES